MMREAPTANGGEKFRDEVSHPKRQKERSQDNRPGNGSAAITNSDTMIYQNVLERIDSHEQVDPEILFKVNVSENANEEERRNSSSSEDRNEIDMSDELMEVEINENFISDCEAEVRRRSVSSDRHSNHDKHAKADDLVRRVEAGQANINVNPGKVHLPHFDTLNLNERELTSAMDDSYNMVGSNLDLLTKEKIRRGEYVDFSKLLPKDKLPSASEEGRMDLIHKGGQTYFVPALEREGVAGNSITGFYKWEQAF